MHRPVCQLNLFLIAGPLTLTKIKIPTKSLKDTIFVADGFCMEEVTGETGEENLKFVDFYNTAFYSILKYSTVILHPVIKHILISSESVCF